MIYRTSELGMRLLVRKFLREWADGGGPLNISLGPTKGGNYSDKPNFTKGFEKITKGSEAGRKLGEADDAEEEDNPQDYKASCDLDLSDDEIGGEHSFHGDRMYPCGDGNEYMNIGRGGPFLGHGEVSSEDIEAADEYIDSYKPDEIVAYSRGGAMAVRASNRADSYKFLAPAWDRDKYGADASSIPNIDGKIYHGAGDRFVPVSHSCKGAESSGMDLYIHPDAGHGKVLSHFKNGQLSDYKKASANFLKKCSSDAPDWGGSAVIKKGSAEQQEQIDWFRDNFFNEGKMKITRNDIKKIIKEILTDVDTGRSRGGGSAPAKSMPGLGAEMEEALNMAVNAIKNIPEVQETLSFHIDDYIDSVQEMGRFKKSYANILDWMDDKDIISLEGSSGWYYIINEEFFYPVNNE